MAYSIIPFHSGLKWRFLRHFILLTKIFISSMIRNISYSLYKIMLHSRMIGHKWLKHLLSFFCAISKQEKSWCSFNQEFLAKDDLKGGGMGGLRVWGEGEVKINNSLNIYYLSKIASWSCFFLFYDCLQQICWCFWCEQKR